MMRLARALADPQSVLTLDDDGWTAILCMAHAERLSGTLAHRLDGLPVPPRVADILEVARMNAAEARTRALWEVEMARRALAPLGLPVVLLKGSAFLAAGLEAGQGRLVGDLDILVPRHRLEAAEAALFEAGWAWLKQDAYDDHYYRTWMHELPPMIHRDRDAMIDVHHTILPLTARPKPDAAAMIADSVEIAPGLRMLCPEDVVIHAAAHLLADGDLSGALRNLWDIRCLVEDCPLDGLEQRARRHGLLPAVERALRLSAVLFGNGRPSRRVDRLYIARLTARDGWGRETRKLLRFAFYIRSHLIRMPPAMLVRHLFTKWRKARAGG
jgi:Uncharacterised nucleotidyltransferase